MSGHLDLVTVDLLALPVVLHARAQEHSDELRREFRLMLEGVDGEDISHVPTRLLHLMRSLSVAYSGFTVAQEEELEQAVSAGTASLDLRFTVPAAASGAALELGAALAAADEYCRAGRHLLTLTTPPALLAYREWYLGEFVSQIAGAPPRPWTAVTPVP